MSMTEFLGPPKRALAPMCRRCKARMKRGAALRNTLVFFDDFGGDAGTYGTTFSATGPAEMVACWKCPKCGKSIV